MNQTLMEQKIKDVLSKYSIEDKIKILCSFKDVLNKIQQEINEDYKENYVHCNECGAYSLKSEMQTESENKVSYDECVYIDCGYGDDDEFADVTYRYIWYICPRCGKKILMTRYHISTCNRHDRYGNNKEE